MRLRLGAIPAIFGYRSPEVSDLLRDRNGAVIQTERALSALCMLASGALMLLILMGIVRRFFETFDLAQFILWSCLTALAAWLVGAMLGLLFGLPSVREVRLSDGGGGQQASGALTATGYQESTNLEQVADWVTKILIGLTLTQYSFWEAAFERAFTYSSRLMLGTATAGPAAATIIAVAFAANGFMIVYIAMRRYFIAEMVAGQGDVQNQINAQIEAKRKAGLFQQQSSVTATPNQQANDARSIAETAIKLAPADSLDAAKAIAKQTSDFPDDPWRGKFGGESGAGGCRLTATVTPLDKIDQFFTIRLQLATEQPDDRVGQTATFYLHPTFGPDPKKVAFGADGMAVLEVIAYGAFTVGVLLEDGEKLELNLATLSDAPAAFRQR